MTIELVPEEVKVLFSVTGARIGSVECLLVTQRHDHRGQVRRIRVVALDNWMCGSVRIKTGLALVYDGIGSIASDFVDMVHADEGFSVESSAGKPAIAPRVLEFVQYIISVVRFLVPKPTTVCQR